MPADMPTVYLLRALLEGYAGTRPILMNVAQLPDEDDAAAMELTFSDGKQFIITLRRARK